MEPLRSFWAGAGLVAAAVAAATSVLVVAFVFQAPKPTPAPLSLTAPPGKVLERYSGSGSHVLQFTTPAKATYVLVCEGKPGLSVLSLQVPTCSPGGVHSQLTVGDNLPPQAGKISVYVQTGPKVRWAFEAVSGVGPSQ